MFVGCWFSVFELPHHLHVFVSVLSCMREPRTHPKHRLRHDCLKPEICLPFWKAALNYQCLAYCSIVGRAERLPLLLKGPLASPLLRALACACKSGTGPGNVDVSQGIGIGPKAAFSYDELDVGDIFVESVHQYEARDSWMGIPLRCHMYPTTAKTRST